MNSYESLRRFTLLLSRVKGIGPKTFIDLIDRFGSIEKVYEEFKYESIDKVIKKNMDNFDFDIDNDLVFKLLKDKDIQYVCLWEDNYPSNLKNIYDPPIVLYFKGNYDFARLRQSISIIGSRDYTSYGLKYTEKFTYDLVSSGYSIVSGMALGIDRIAHEAAIEAEGYTVAVLPGSVDKPYPLVNSEIYKGILDNDGLIISEFAPDVKFVPGLFPRRNRITAGISLGTLIVEASENSGSLITASMALECNREVFAIPGNLNNKMSNGTNKLIKNGQAKLVQRANDILEELRYFR